MTRLARRGGAYAGPFLLRHLFSGGLVVVSALELRHQFIKSQHLLGLHWAATNLERLGCEERLSRVIQPHGCASLASLGQTRCPVVKLQERQ